MSAPSIRVRWPAANPRCQFPIGLMHDECGSAAAMAGAPLGYPLPMPQFYPSYSAWVDDIVDQTMDHYHAALHPDYDTSQDNSLCEALDRQLEAHRLHLSVARELQGEPEPELTRIHRNVRRGFARILAGWVGL